MIVITFLDFVGWVTAVLFLLTLALGIYTWFRGILPALIRLGNGLAKRKIAIFQLKRFTSRLKTF